MTTLRYCLPLLIIFMKPMDKDFIAAKILQIREGNEALAEHLGVGKTIFDRMREAYSVKDTAAILGCSQSKVRQYMKYRILQGLKIGHKSMITSTSIKELIHNNVQKQ